MLNILAVRESLKCILRFFPILVRARLFCRRYSLEDARRLEKAFQNAPISDFSDDTLCFEPKFNENGYTWSRVFAGCLEYEELIAVPLDMPPATVSSPA